MRKITKLAVEAFKNGEDFKLQNTEVKNGAMYLHGNKIAWIEDGKLMFSCCGWDTPTTFERLRGLGINIGHKNYETFHNDRLINAYDTYEA